MRGAMDMSTLRKAEFNIDWAEFSNEDIGVDQPDEGWYLSVTINGQTHTLGHDEFGPGFKTVDEALAYAQKWATDRGMEFHRPIVEAVATYHVPQEGSEDG